MVWGSIKLENGINYILNVLSHSIHLTIFISICIGMGLKKADPDVFFLDVLAVTATRFRPLNRMGDRTMEHPQNVHLAKILTVNKELLVLGADKECVPPPPISSVLAYSTNQILFVFIVRISQIRSYWINKLPSGISCSWLLMLFLITNQVSTTNVSTLYHSLH